MSNLFKKNHTRRKKRGGGSIDIPKIVMQTSKNNLPEKQVEQLKKKIDGWQYQFFNDTDILKFFKDNSDNKYKNIAEKFNSIPSGEHKADLFRYYYIYKKGGVYLDSDLMIYDSLDTIIGKNTFVSVRALSPEGSCFNGFIAAIPGHPIIEKALAHMYTIDYSVLKSDYYSITKEFCKIIRDYEGGSVKLLDEVKNTDRCFIRDLESGKISLIHYHSGPIPDNASK